MKRLLVFFLILSQLLFSCGSANVLKSSDELAEIANGIFEEVTEEYGYLYTAYLTNEFCGIKGLYSDIITDDIVANFVIERVNKKKLSEKNRDHVVIMVMLKYYGFQEGVLVQTRFTIELLKSIDVSYCTIPQKVGAKMIKNLIE